MLRGKNGLTPFAVTDGKSGKVSLWRKLRTGRKSRAAFAPFFVRPRHRVMLQYLMQTFPAFPDVWRLGLDALRNLPDGSAALLLGSTDRGKTTFAARAARILAGEMERVAVIDADVGQSEIGPPGTVGWGWAHSEIASLHDIKPAGLFFTGAFAPNLAALEHVAAVSRSVQAARQKNAARILVDTTGFVFGPAARRLKVAKAQMISPHLIIAFALGEEIADLCASVRAATGAELLLLPPAPETIKKPQGLRNTRRLTRLGQAFNGGREIVFGLRDLITVGGILGSGEPVAPHNTEWAARALRLPVVYAEKSSDGVLSVFANHAPHANAASENTGPVAAYFGARTVRILSLPAYFGVLLGLHDETGTFINIGRFASFDALHHDVTIFAALSPSQEKRVRLVSFGRVRVSPDGVPLGEVKTGEI